MAFLHSSVLVARDAKLDPSDPHRPLSTYDPRGMLDRLSRTFRRRLSDRVEDVFRDACVLGDLDTAEALLAVLENMHARRCEKFGQDRRISDEGVVKARADLALRKAAVSSHMARSV